MVNTVPTGSHGRLMRDIARAASGAGFDTVMAAGRDAGDGVVRIGSRRDVLLHVARTRLLDGHARGSQGATKAFVAELEAMKPDLLHLHNVHGYYLHAETLFAYIRSSGIPTVWTLHDCWAFTGHCSHFVRANCALWQTGCHNCPLLGEYPASILLDASQQNWQWKRAAFAGIPNLTLVSPSGWLADRLADSFLRDTPRLVIPNGINLGLFRPEKDAQVRARFGVKPGQVMLLAVAAPFDRRKGFADALRVAELLGDRAKLVLVGLSEKQLRSLPEGVSGIARTDGPEALVALYGAADCLINPTYEDTYPTVNMEAMACGTPVAAYAVGGCVEQIAELCGVLAPCGDAGGLAEAALVLGARKRMLTDACREHAEEHFDRRNAVAAYVAAYQNSVGA